MPCKKNDMDESSALPQRKQTNGCRLEVGAQRRLCCIKQFSCVKTTYSETFVH